MGYGRTILIDDPVAEAIAKVKDALKAQGFGTLTEIDVQATLKERRSGPTSTRTLSSGRATRDSRTARSSSSRTSGCSCRATSSCAPTVTEPWSPPWIRR